MKISEKFPRTAEELLEILNAHSNTLPAGYYLSSDPAETYLHERSYKDVVNEIMDLIYWDEE